MQQKYTAILKQDARVWVGWVEEVPGVNCHANSREALQESLMAMLTQILAFTRRTTLDVSEICFKDKA